MMLTHSQFTQRDSRHLCASAQHAPQPQEISDLLDMAACFQLASTAFSRSSPSSISNMKNGCNASWTNGDSRLAALLLVYPCLDPSRSGASHSAHAASPTLAASELMWFWKQYVPGFSSNSSGAAGVLYAPLNAEDDALRLMPPCFIATAGCDPLCDDGLSLVARFKVSMLHRIKLMCDGDVM
jgi:hypothetical protein